MALVSGPTVGNAISDPENAVAKLVDAVKDNSEVVKNLWLRFLNRPGDPQEVTAATKMFDDLDAEHAKLVVELDAYSKELAPKLAQRELDRQNKIAGLQTELEAYREIAALRGPRAEQERNDKIAKAQAAVADYDKKLLADLPKWEAGQKKKTRWYPIEPAELGATYRAKLTQQPDGSIFVAGEKAKGSYRIVAPVLLDKVTGIRLEALADDRIANKGPGRGTGGNFVVTEFTARELAAGSPTKLVRSWDFAPGENDWQADAGVKIIADGGMRHLFGNGRRAGLKTTLKLPAGQYLVDVVTGVRPTVSVTLQWTTANGPNFDDIRATHRVLPAGSGGSLATPITIDADSELTGLRIIVDDDQTVLPIDAIRLFSSDGSSAADLKLAKAKATFSQAGYTIASAIDGNKGAETDNGWAISPQLGRDHSAHFELVSPLNGAKNRLVEFMIYQNFADGQHSLGKFRISVTDSKPPLNFGLPPAITAILAKAADKRSDAEKQALVAQERMGDKPYAELRAALAAAQQSMAADPHVKELEDQLAAAKQPLALDSKLQQMRRAVELSEEQMKNKRLTVAQDIVWALINNPAFLYNH
jgi:hypothetical protein